MAWTMTERARAAKVRREWYCDECSYRWRTVTDQDDESEPECPECAAHPERVLRPVAYNGTAAKALDFAQRMIESQTGATNMRDHLQPGENAAMPPPPIQTAEADAITRALINQGGVPQEVAPHLQAQVKNFFGAGMGANPLGLPTTPEEARAMAAPAAAIARSEGVDPVGLLHEAGKQGLDRTKNLTVHSK